VMSATATRYVNICEEPGAALNIGLCRWTPDQAGANSHLLMMLGELTGRLEPSGVGGYCQTGVVADGWMRLVDVDAAALSAIVRRMERAYPSWKPDADGTLPIHGQIQMHFNTAQERWLREQAA
jgi:hypothetical protein